MSKMEEKNDDNIDDNNDVYLYKIIVLGDFYSGKTSLILRFCDDLYENIGTSTIGVDMKTKFVRRQGKKIELQIWDTAGQERFRSLAKNSINNMDGIILIYDIGIKESFNNMKKWFYDLKDTVDFKKVGIIVVGNQSDKPSEVNESMAQEFCHNNNIAFIEASIKDDINVNETFIKLIDIMVKINSKKPKSKMGKLNFSIKEEVKLKKKEILLK